MDNLFENRCVTADWHLAQSRRLLEVAFTEGSATALVYAALEARNAIERLPFEMSALATGGDLTEEQLHLAQKKDGVFLLLDQTLHNYRRHIEFQNICMDVMGAPLRFPVPDIRRFKRLRTDLNPYCHCQLDPRVTLLDRTGKWFISGAAAVKCTCDFLEPLLSENPGGMDPKTMPEEVREVFDAYIEGDIGALSARTRLEIMYPVLVERLILYKERPAAS